MCIDAQSNLVSLKVEGGVEVLQHQVADYEGVAMITRQHVLVNLEEAIVRWAHEEVLSCGDLVHHAAQLEGDGL